MSTVKSDQTLCFPEQCQKPRQVEDRDQTARISTVMCLRCLNITYVLLHANFYAFVVCEGLNESPESSHS